MDALVKLRTIALDADLEPAEEVYPTGPAARRGAKALSGCGGECERAITSLARRTLADRGLRGPALDRKAHALGIRNAVMPGGRRAPLLKTMLTSVCERNCYYCPFRAGRDYRRATLQPDEIADLFMQMVRAGLVKGLFLSSGVVSGGVSTQDKLIDAADILRNRYGYRGYLHLKLMPGAEKDQVLRAMQLADRVSINLEAPNSERLARLAPAKVYLDELLQPLTWAEEIRRVHSPYQAHGGRWPSIVTQFVVGAAGESDAELLRTTLPDPPLASGPRLLLVLFAHSRYTSGKHANPRSTARTPFVPGVFPLSRLRL